MNDNETIKEFMQRDHKRLDELSENFQSLKSKDTQKAKNSFCSFRRGLFAHIEWEEKILFPTFEDRTGMKDNGPTSVMRAEHVRIKDLLDRIRKNIKAGNFNTEELDDELTDILRGHNDKEENILYTLIDEALGEGERELIFRQIKEMTPPNTCGCSH